MAGTKKTKTICSPKTTETQKKENFQNKVKATSALHSLFFYTLLLLLFTTPFPFFSFCFFVLLGSINFQQIFYSLRYTVTIAHLLKHSNLHTHKLKTLTKQVKNTTNSRKNVKNIIFMQLQMIWTYFFSFLYIIQKGFMDFL